MLRHVLLLPLQSFDNISTGAYGETYVATARESLDAPYVALQYSRSFLPVSMLDSMGSLQLPDCSLCLTASDSRRCWHPQAPSTQRSPVLVASDLDALQLEGVTGSLLHAYAAASRHHIAHISRPAGRLLPCNQD